MQSMLCRMRRAVRVLHVAGKSFIADEVFHLSAGLSFFGLLSLIPLTLIMISVVGHVLGYSEEMFLQISTWIQQSIPSVSDNAIVFLRSLIDHKVARGWTGLAVLVIAASFLFTSIERTLDIVLKSQRRRNFFHSYAFSFGLVFLVTLLFFVPTVIGASEVLLQKFGISLDVAEIFRGHIFFFVAHAIIFMVLLRLVPKQRIPLRAVARGALLFGLMVVLARWGFHTYMGYAFERYHVIYGSLTALVMLVLWLYYLSAVFLYSAEVVRLLDRNQVSD